MYSLYLVIPTQCFLAEFASVAEAVAFAWQNWNEEPAGPQVFTVEADGGSTPPLAVLTRHPDDPELCITSWSGGRVETHRCRYVVDAGGTYQRTEVSLVSAQQVAADQVQRVPSEPRETPERCPGRPLDGGRPPEGGSLCGL